MVQMIQKMEPLPKYGTRMTMVDWMRCVKQGGFMDYDGFGYYSDGKEMETTQQVHPSMLGEGTLDKTWSHIIWFNR